MANNSVNSVKTPVKKIGYEYAIRFNETDEGNDKLKVLIFIKRSEPINCIMAFEKGEKTDVPHYHLYLHTLKSIKQLRNLKNYVLPMHKKHTSAIALCKNPENQKSYVLKDGLILHNTFSSAETEAIKKWVPKKQYKPSVLTELKNAIKCKDLEDIFNEMMEFYDTRNMPFDKYRMKNYGYAVYYHNNAKDKQRKKEILLYLLG